MNCVEIVGGLANQMFGYAFAVSLGRNTYLYKNAYGHNGYELDRVFGVKTSRVNRWVVKLYDECKDRDKYFKFIREKREFEYNAEVYNVKTSRIKYYIGYWQNEGYLLRNEQKIRGLFSFDRNKFLPLTIALAQKLEGRKNSVSLHIRRGDYYSNPEAMVVHGNICDIDYYERAIETIKCRVPDAEFYIFSDEPQWVKENFKRLENAVYIDWNRGENSWQDMALMSFCSHHIIANSSFSWWGAWLATPDEGKVVITPSKWLNTRATMSIVPERWTKI